MTSSTLSTPPPSESTPAESKRPGFVRRIYDWTLSLAERKLAGLWLGLISAAEASFFPIPPDVLLIPLCLGSTKKALRFATICSLASVVGGIGGYVIGHYFWEATQGFFFSYVPGFTEAKFDHFKQWFEKYGILVVFAAGFSPIPYKIFTICSGVAGMAFLPFVLASAVSRSARFFLVALLIARFGEPMKDFIDRYFNKLALLFVILLAGGFAAVKFML
jgi:membrane protein YqaA with SNARE-associated domain